MAALSLRVLSIDSRRASQQSWAKEVGWRATAPAAAMLRREYRRLRQHMSPNEARGVITAMMAVSYGMTASSAAQ